MDDIREIRNLLTYNLQYFAEGADKTEEPTAKKLKDARMDGQVARSKELTTASSLIGLFLVLNFFMGFMSNRFLEAFRKTYSSIEVIAKDDSSAKGLKNVVMGMILDIVIICLPVLLIGLVISFLVVLVQVKWKVSKKPLQPKLSKINPFTGFKKLFNKDKLVELLFEVIKISVITYLVIDALKDESSTLLLLYDLELMQGILLIGDFIISLGLKISIILFVIGVADLFYQKKKFKKDMKMSKQEVKDEFKQQEGDPQIKGKIRAKMREASQRRMMKAIPQADVVITNPTHLAAAIKYDRESADAPILLAKGADFVAMRIREIAKENNIAIVENKPLARMLYYNVELGEQIPPELYQMTADVLAYVYGLQGK